MSSQAQPALFEERIKVDCDELTLWPEISGQYPVSVTITVRGVKYEIGVYVAGTYSSKSLGEMVRLAIEDALDYARAGVEL